MERNKDEIRDDTFFEFMQAPCGRLLTKVVLNDLGKPEYYANLRKLRLPFWENAKRNCRKQETKVFVNPNFVPPKTSHE